MIDLETLGTRADAAIVQIGAVEFEPVAGGKLDCEHPFNYGVDLHHQRRHIDPDTLCWWLDQSVAARRNFLDVQAEAHTLEGVLTHLTRWFHIRAISGVWGHGAAFDIAVLEHAYAQCELEPPWHHRDVRDTRTLFWHRGYTMPKAEHTGTAHDALDDAIFQAQQVQRALHFV
jgi:exodeoxyribonuclease VIII